MAESILELIFRTRKTGDGEKQAASGLKGLNNAFSSLTGVSLTTAGAIAAVVGALKFCVEEAQAAEKNQAQLTAVIASTGGAAGMTANDINQMATQLSELTAVEDDTIVKAASVMLTFTRIGKETFPEAMTAALNMSAALGQDLQSSVMQLGKALNDPIQGMSALRRVGVSFSEAQVEMVKRLVATGDALGAQKLILGELNKEFGGVAESVGDTASGKMQKFQNAVGNLGEKLGGYLLPALSNAADGLTGFIKTMENGIGVAEQLATWNEKIAQALSEQAGRVLETSQSYDEYVKGMVEAGIAAGKLDESFRAMYDDTGKLRDSQEGYNIYLDEATTKMGLLTAAQWELIASSDGSDEHLRRMMNNFMNDADKAVAKAGDVETAVDSLPTEHEIKIAITWDDVGMPESVKQALGNYGYVPSPGTTSRSEQVLGGAGSDPYGGYRPPTPGAPVSPITERASGGPVFAGQTVLVGEQGPEVVYMPSDGVVYPNKSLAMGWVNLNFYGDISVNNGMDMEEIIYYVSKRVRG